MLGRNKLIIYRSVYYSNYFFYICPMSKAARTRQFIAEKTAPILNKKGFGATSLRDFTDATGLTKGALYGNFKDKEDIASAAFAYSVAKVKKLVGKKVERATTYQKQLEALLDFYSEYVFNPPVPGGCPLLNAAVETDDFHTSMRKVVAKELVSTIDFIDSLLQKGIAAGEFISEIKTRELAYTFFCAVEGALMFARVERSKEPMDIIVNHCKKILNDITKR